MHKIYLISATYVEELRTFEDKMKELLANQEAYASFVDDEDENDGEKNYQVLNGVALYGIKGKMLSSGNWVTKLFGIPTYDAIGSDLAQMAQDDSIEKVLVAMDTPGGHMAGISDLSDTWQRLNAMKPITVHTSGGVGSAGTWLASNSSAFYASETAEVGSIGVIIQHVSQEKALDNAGIKVTEIKSAPLKYVGSPAKDLTTEAQAYLQKKVDESFSLFKKQMYKTRPGITEEAFTGEMFSTSDALRLGLIDGINTYSGVFEKLSASAGSNNQHSYREDFGMKRKVTAAMASAAIESGADPKTLEIVSDAVYAEMSNEERGVLTAEEGDALINRETEGETLTELSAETQELMLQADTLREELATALAQVETLTAEVADLTTQLDASAADPLRVIAEDRLKVMRTALGMVNIDMSEFPTSSLLAEYNATDKQFKKAYKPGGHVKTKAQGDEDPAPKKATITSIETARFKSTGL